MSSDSTEPRAQRAWRALCPGCGAPVDFASAASASAICSFCRSTLVREGEVLRRVGVVSELFDDHSPLQLGATGRHQRVGFTIVGRLQYRYLDGTWNEWHVLFDEATPRSAWLSEDNGAYVLSFDLPTPADVPDLGGLMAGQRCVVDGRAWSVASTVSARLISAQGELPRPPKLDGDFAVVDLRNERGEVGTLDGADAQRVQWSVGQSVRLTDLSLQGLREDNDQGVAGRTFTCPNCGAPLAPTLATTQSLTCGSCRSVVDISQGVGADLQHYEQANSGPGGLEPEIPLGRTGRLALGPGGPQDWQVVGFQERCDIPNRSDDEDEQTFWREYLLYNRKRGFVFLVDAEDGWSWVAPITGVPVVKGKQATVDDKVFTRRYARYKAKVTWVQGEFYWTVRRGETAWVTDYDGIGNAKLSREVTGREVVWSMGQGVSAADVGRAFQVPSLAQRRPDAAPVSEISGGTMIKLVAFVVVALVLILMVTRCSDDDCNKVATNFGTTSREYQQCLSNRSSGGFRTSSGGGSFGGFSSGGGGHK